MVPHGFYKNMSDLSGDDERRRSPRYSTNFLTRNRISVKGDNGNFYEGLTTVENISREGMCLFVDFNNEQESSQYEAGKPVQLFLDLFFSGSVINYEGRIAWVQRQGKTRARIGLNFLDSIQGADDILTLFSREKQAQEKFYLTVI